MTDDEDVMALPRYGELALRKSVGGGHAADVYPHLAEPGAQRQLLARRQQLDLTIATINRGLPDEDAPRVQSRRQSMSESLYPYLSETAICERERYERWQERMLPRGFSLKRAPQGHSDWWSRKGK
jgi:hypothetical protein